MTEETDRAAAVEDLAARIRQRDHAIRTGETDGVTVDAELFAGECMTALYGRGWRPGPARRPPPWNTGQPRADHPGTAEYRRARAAWEASEHPNTSGREAAS